MEEKKKKKQEEKKKKEGAQKKVCVTVLDGIFTFMRNIQILILWPLLL